MTINEQLREQFKQDDLRLIWEAKCGIDGESEESANVRFQMWLAEKKANGFDRV